MEKVDTFKNQGVSEEKPVADPNAAPLFANERNALEAHLRLKRHDHHDLEPVKSGGEATFDKITYKGIGWLGNAALSVYLADLFKNGKGKPYFDYAADYLTPKFHQFSGQSLENARGSVRSGLIMAGLITGGFILMGPVKYLEDHKLSIVTWLDKKHNEKAEKRGEPVSKEELEIQQYAHERIAKAPKQTWGSILGGRAAGLVAVAVVAFGFAKGRDEKSADFVAEKLAGEMRKSNNSWAQTLGASKRFKNITSLTFMDLIYSLICEEVLFHSTRLYESIKGKKNHSVDTENEKPALPGKRAPYPEENRELSPIVADRQIQNLDNYKDQLDAHEDKNKNWKDRVNSLAPSYQDMALKRTENTEYLGMGA